jgi:hypothetical protein
MTGATTLTFWALCAGLAVLWLAPSLILAVTYALCNRDAETAYRAGHRDGWLACQSRDADQAEAAHVLTLGATPEVQTDAALVRVAAELVDLADHLRDDRRVHP